MSAATLSLINDPLPLTTDSDGVIRIGKSRVTLDTVVTVFENGASPEEIVCQYPALYPADVYSVISYYLKNKKEVEKYLNQRKSISRQVKKQNQIRFPSENIRDRLLARRGQNA